MYYITKADKDVTVEATRHRALVETITYVSWKAFAAQLLAPGSEVWPEVLVD